MGRVAEEVAEVVEGTLAGLSSSSPGDGAAEAEAKTTGPTEADSVLQKKGRRFNNNPHYNDRNCRIPYLVRLLVVLHVDDAPAAIALACSGRRGSSDGRRAAAAAASRDEELRPRDELLRGLDGE